MIHRATIILLQIIFCYMMVVATRMYGTLGYSIPLGLLVSCCISRKLVENMEKYRLKERNKC